MLVAAPAAALGMFMGVLVFVIMLVVVRMPVPAAASAVSMVVMTVVVPMRMIVIMAATAAAVVVMVLVRIGQHRRKPPLERDGLFARRLTRFNRERHHFRADAQVVHLSQIVTPETPLAVENENRGRALDLIRLHGLWQAAFVAGLVEGYGE